MQQVVVDNKNKLIEIAMQCNVQALYYFQPESHQNLFYMARAHFLVVPIASKMSNNNLYELESQFKTVLCCKVFIKTEEHLQYLLKDHILSQAEYDVASKKDFLLFEQP